MQMVRLWPAERLMLTVAAACFVLDVVLVAFNGVNLDWISYGFTLAMPVLFTAVGLTMRATARSERLAAMLVGAGIFMFFSTYLNLFSYLFLPLKRETFDALLVTMDAALGFSWVNAMVLAVDYPLISDILKAAYVTTLPQVSLIIILLALLNRRHELDHFMISVTFSATVTVCFWVLFPTLGPSGMLVDEVPQSVWRNLQPIVNEYYARELVEIAKNGPGFVTPSEVRGLIGFPSYHAILAFSVAYAGWKIAYLRWPILILNALVLPSIFIQGGHHLMDLFGGLAVFILGTVLATHTVNRMGKDRHTFKPVVEGQIT